MAYADDYLGKDMPKLGFGMMRLPKLEDGSIDIEQVKEMVDIFMGAGLTYFDTAFVYDNGESEVATRKALVERYPRDSFTVTTKLNAWLGDPTEEEAKRQFEISLERLGVDYFDFYLLHVIQENNWETYERYGLWDFVRSMKEKGLVKRWGFSFHASPELLEKMLTTHPEVDFIQLQVNYADMEDPVNESRRCIEVAQAHGVPYTIMEPVKGGMLANPPRAVRDIFDAANAELGRNLSYAGWALRFAASQPGVICALSGMSNIEQTKDNVSFMGNFEPLSAEEAAVVAKAQDVLNSCEQIKCTGCHYCTEGCPMGIPIPDFFSAMNRKLIFENEADAKRRYANAVSMAGVSAADCIQCGQCEGACPQRLPIISYLADVDAALA